MLIVTPEGDPLEAPPASVRVGATVVHPVSRSAATVADAKAE